MTAGQDALVPWGTAEQLGRSHITIQLAMVTVGRDVVEDAPSFAHDRASHTAAPHSVASAAGAAGSGVHGRLRIVRTLTLDSFWIKIPSILYGPLFERHRGSVAANQVAEEHSSDAGRCDRDDDQPPITAPSVSGGSLPPRPSRRVSAGQRGRVALDGDRAHGFAQDGAPIPEPTLRWIHHDVRWDRRDRRGDREHDD